MYNHTDCVLKTGGMKKILLLTILGIFGCSLSFAQTHISAKDAPKHLNETVTICDKVFSGKYFTSSSLTLLDIGGFHPHELLTLVIKAADKKKFKSAPDELFKGKNVCVTGKVIDFKGKPEIEITDPAQIKVQ